MSTLASAQDAAQVRLLASNCTNCHGPDGRSQGGIATLAGQPKAQLADAMLAFKSGKRPATVMQQLSKGYTDAEIDALAGFFSAQKN
ncbi:MAG: c-type cytochrome [Betaproteobacteria bacterium]